MHATSFVTALAALGLAIGGSHHATTRHTCAFDLTGRFTEIAVDSGAPPRSGSNTGVAAVDGTVCGRQFHGAARDINRFPRFGAVDGTGVIFSPLGSIKVAFAATATIGRDRSASIRGTTRVVGGTGLYAGATGSGVALGRQPAGSPVTVQHLRGTITF